MRTSEKIVIIGSGIGGLSCAIILSKLGYDVTVFEKNRHPGGMMRSYRRQGVHCDVGVHYLGALDEGQVLRRCFDYLGIADGLSLTRMGADGVVDRYLFGSNDLGLETFDGPVGLDAYQANLLRSFPSQRTQIEELSAILRRSAEEIDRLDFLYSDQPTQSWLDHTESLGAIFDRLHCSPGLRAVFGLPSVLIGVPHDQCPQFYHTMTLASYLMSAWRLEGHGAQMADACVARLGALGGKLRVAETVAAIRTIDGAVRGVTLYSGEQVDADVVLAAIHPKTMLPMLPAEAFKPSYRRRILGLIETKGMVAVHALVPADKHPALSHNLFAVRTNSGGGVEDAIFTQLRPSGDPRSNLLSLITAGHEIIWEPWRETLTGRRGPEYVQRKMELARALIARSERSIGPIHDARILDVSTPLTIRDWVNSPNGSAYGIQRSTQQMLSAALLNRTALRGLFLAGQNVLAPGILGTILGSLTTVQFIVGQERFRKEVCI
jgi:phytoene dehydrogenase-like protein